MSTERDGRATRPGQTDLTRRDLLQRAGVAGIAVYGTGFLAACGGGAASKTTKTSSAGADLVAGTPGRGGVLRVGMLGNGTGESYNPGTASANIDYCHVRSVFDFLVRGEPNHKQGQALAVGWSHNADATVWELKLRPGVTWHNGKPFTADDVIYSMRAMGDPAHLGNPSVANVKLRDLKKLGDHVVQVPLKSPDATWITFMRYTQTAIFPDGFKPADFAKPIGTGPYKLKSFTAGERSVLTPNPDYWENGKPYPDELQIISIDDDAARVNALESGQIDICAELPRPTAKANVNNANGSYVVSVGGPTWHHNIVMRVDSGPFRDERVRQAMMLIADRQQLIDTALSGFGVLANDMMGVSADFYNKTLPQRKQDIEQAKSLLKAAGQPDLRLTLDTAPIHAGTVQAAQVYAQQASAAGVTIKVRRQTTAAYFDPKQLFLKMPFGQDFWGVNSIKDYFQQALLKGAVYNETHWNDPTTESLFVKATAETNEATARDLWNQIQEIQYRRGGQVVWAAEKETTGVSKKVRGFGGPGHGVWEGPDDFLVANWGLA